MKIAMRTYLLAFALLTAWPQDASALTIVTHFIGGTPPARWAGGGNLPDIFEAAARRWVSVYLDSFTIHLYYGWATLEEAGTHILIDQGGEPNREVAGLILFDNSGAVSFFLDPTPDLGEEYQRYTEEYQELGSGLLNVARVYSAPNGSAAGHCDLLSVAIHEIGHALGMCSANLRFLEEKAAGAIWIRGELPYAGTVVPLASNHRGVTSHIDPTRVVYGSVMSGICSDERRLPSTLDILANAQISGFRILNLNPLPNRQGESGSPEGLNRANRLATSRDAR
ncbi:MAG: hypothetical protein HXY20_07905 [Acidobacteria bacterium]|nr:hypothetical protein [Acidobacteriota bacterium]